MALVKKIELSKRLQHAAKFVVPDEPIADIGSDHAYLPIYLVQQKKVPTAIAGEVALGPLKHAENIVMRYGLANKISVRLGDGLEVLEEKEALGTIFICGMGGLLIKKILSSGYAIGKIPQKTRLVLQANNEEKALREFLMKENYEIIAEDILEDKGKTYEIIVAEFSKTAVVYSEFELFFGPQLLAASSATFRKKWSQALKTNERILAQLLNTEHEEKILEIQEKIQKIKQVIS